MKTKKLSKKFITIKAKKPSKTGYHLLIKNQINITLIKNTRKEKELVQGCFQLSLSA